MGWFGRVLYVASGDWRVSRGRRGRQGGRGESGMGGKGRREGRFKKIADNPDLNAFPRGQDTASRERGAGRDAVLVACCSAVYF